MSKLANITVLRYLHDKLVYPFYLLRNKKIFSNLRKSVKIDNKIVLFLTVRTFVANPQTYLEATLAHALEASGLRVLMLYCDSVLCSCDADTHIDLKKRRILCNRCKNNRKQLIESLCLEYCSYRQFLTKDILKKIDDLLNSTSHGIEDLRNLTLYGVNVGEHAVTSVVRYFLTHSFNDNDPRHLKVFKEKLYTACASVELANQLYAAYGSKIGHVIMVHGVYSTWGPFYDYFKSRGIDSVIYSLGIIHPGSMAFHRNGREWERFYPDTWKKLKLRDLTSEELKDVDDYINNRFFNNLGIDLMLYNQVATGEKKKVLDNLNRKTYSNRYVFYTHMIWDSVLENQSRAFNGFIDMFNKTVEYFLRNPQKQLVIKVHPAELVWEKGSYSMLDYIRDNFPELTDNIYVLPPSTPVSSYEILNKETVGLTYVGSIGYELSAIGVPVLVGGSIHYQNEGGVGVGIESLAHYYALLDDPKEAFEISRKNIGLAKKWCYYFYYMLHFDFPVSASDCYAKIDWKQMGKLRTMLADKESSLNKICRKIKEKTDIVND